MTESKYKVATEQSNFWKVRTNIYGGLRFKLHDEDGKPVDENRAIELYAAQVSTDRRKVTAKQVEKLPGFNVSQIRDESRCLQEVEEVEQEKSSPQKSSESSSTASPES